MYYRLNYYSLKQKQANNAQNLTSLRRGAAAAAADDEVAAAAAAAATAAAADAV